MVVGEMAVSEMNLSRNGQARDEVFLEDPFDKDKL